MQREELVPSRENAHESSRGAHLPSQCAPDKNITFEHAKAKGHV